MLLHFTGHILLRELLVHNEVSWVTCWVRLQQNGSTCLRGKSLVFVEPQCSPAPSTERPACFIVATWPSSQMRNKDIKMFFATHEHVSPVGPVFDVYNFYTWMSWWECWLLSVTSLYWLLLHFSHRVWYAYWFVSTSVSRKPNS